MNKYSRVLTFYNNTESIYVQRFFKDKTSKILHKHDFFQIIFIEDGTYRHNFSDKTAIMEKGDVLIVSPNMKHSIEAIKNPSCILAITFKNDFLHEIVHTNGSVADFLNNLPEIQKSNPKPVIKLENDDKELVYSLLNRMIDEYDNPNLGTETIIKNALLIIISIILRNYFKDDIKKDLLSYISSPKQSILYCIDYIESKCSEDITLDSICKMALLNKSYFSKKFYEITGMNFKKFLNEKRIEKACDMIMQREDIKLNEICTACGYKDFTTFWRNFKKIKGENPNEYKKRHNDTMKFTKIDKSTN